MSDKSSYGGRMSEIITVRSDDATRRALAELTADGTKVSDAVRAAVIDSASRHAKQRLRAEVAEVAADPVDLQEAQQVLADMESLGAW